MALEKLDTEARREQIVEAALSLIAAQGGGRISVAALARRVGVVPSALYRHFKSKEEIIQAAVQWVRRRVGENMREVCQATPNALERLDWRLRRGLNMGPGLEGMPAHRLSWGDAMLKEILGEIENIMRQGQERGEIRSDLDARSLAVMFWGMVPAAVILWHMSDGQFDVTRQAEKTWDLLKESIRAQ